MSDIKALIEKAQDAAISATAEYIKKNPDQWYPCGFAWVNIKPARGPLVNEMKKMGLGRRDEYYGGWTIWNPSQHSTQCMDALAAGARAFSDVLKEAGYNVYAATRMD
jgi:hypothetical protein